MLTKTYLKNLIYQVTGAAIEVHKNLGPGLLESTYHRCMKYELSLRNISFKSELSIPIHYKGFDLDAHLGLTLAIINGRNTVFY